MIWLASFPRSGNTFFRNILYEVYGLKSSTYHQDADYFLDKDYAAFPCVKTHLLPSQLVPADPDIKAVYIIRDGRDTMVSLAHHRKDIVAPGSDFHENLKAAIIAEKGSFFGGWSRNVLEWIDRADIIIRYEDLLADPLACAERLRAIMHLPAPDASKLPGFNKMKAGVAEYGSGKGRGLSEEEMLALSAKNFRKGKAGGWRDEMSDEMHDLFWSYHGEVMEHLGYGRDGNIISLNPDFDFDVALKLGQKLPSHERKMKVLLEAEKMVHHDNDGVKRYQSELLKQFNKIEQNPDARWHFDLFMSGRLVPLKEFNQALNHDFSMPEQTAKGSQTPAEKRSLFQRFEFALLEMIPDRWVSYLISHNILVFHKLYDGIKKAAFGLIDFVIDTVKKISAFILRLLFRMRDNKRLNRLTLQFNRYDLIHLPLQQHFFSFRKTARPLLVTIHDFTHRLFPEHHTAINISNAEQGLKFISQRKAHVLAVSASTLHDTQKELKLPEYHVHMVHEAADREKFSFRINRDETRKIKEKYGIPDGIPYLLSLSTIEPRKNLGNTIQAFLRLATKHEGLHLNLVIAGKKGWMTNKLFVQNKLFTDRVFFTGFIDDGDLAALYSEALALTYLSFYEGFGLPPLEAMSCGTPVIYSNRSSLPEIIADGGLSANPDDIEEIMTKFEQIYANPALRESLGRKALKRSLDFSWRKAAIETLQVYEKVISSSNE
ncbi:MAG: glycosyltransferase [Bacteroidetes bacterium]|nr:glycosyltransferase [Bacteroidota bacterium]